jgi:L-amino acid N-acyltransferase YncA
MDGEPGAWQNGTPMTRVDENYETNDSGSPERALRPATEEDAAQIGAIYAPFVRNTHASFELEPPDETEMRRRIRETLKTHPWIVCARGGEVLGYAYATPYRTRAAYSWGTETTVYVKEGARRSGLGRLLYGTLLALLRLQGYRMVYAAISLPNPGSVGLHEALGFEPIGVYHAAGFKHGAWHDVGWWQLQIGPLDPAPEAPIPFPEFRDTPACLSALALPPLSR